MTNQVNRDSRLNREGSERAERVKKDRAITQNRELTDQERLDALRRNFFAQSLPDLPEIDGFHVCWLTTTNPRDPIAGRIRLGYEFIRAADIPGWEYAALKTGDYIGCVGVNEMIAMKLPMHLYEMYMTESHHNAPNQEEEKLRANIESWQEEALRKRAKLIVEEGNEGIGNAPSRPIFEGTSLEE